MTRRANRVFAVLLQLLSHGSNGSDRSFVEIRYVGWRGRGRSSQDVAQNELSSNHGRSPARIARYRQHTGLTEESTALFCGLHGQLHAPELGSGDVLDDA